MKGLIFYFSLTGNTLLACNYIAQEIKSINIELCDITDVNLPDLSAYSFIGFASYVHSLGLPYLIQDFINRLPQQEQKYSFVFNTYANFYGQTLKIMKNLLKRKGFMVITGYALHSPENYPPYIAKGIIHRSAPNDIELKEFKSFITKLDQCFADLKNGKMVSEEKIHSSWLNNILPTFSQKRSAKKMGKKFVDSNLCNKCGKCKKVCPYQAIEFITKPVFNETKCYGCWSCYNHCPTQAIYTSKLKGIGHYPKPNNLIQEKFKKK